MKKQIDGNLQTDRIEKYCNGYDPTTMRNRFFIGSALVITAFSTLSEIKSCHSSNNSDYQQNEIINNKDAYHTTP